MKDLDIRIVLRARTLIPKFLFSFLDRRLLGNIYRLRCYLDAAAVVCRTIVFTFLCGLTFHVSKSANITEENVSSFVNSLCNHQ